MFKIFRTELVKSSSTNYYKITRQILDPIREPHDIKNKSYRLQSFYLIYQIDSSSRDSAMIKIPYHNHIEIMTLYTHNAGEGAIWAKILKKFQRVKPRTPFGEHF